MTQILVGTARLGAQILSVTLEPLRLLEQERLEGLAHDIPAFEKRGHRGAAHDRQVAPEQYPVEATQSPADPVGVLFDELVHARDQNTRNSAVQPSVGRGVVESARAAGALTHVGREPLAIAGPGAEPHIGCGRRSALG